MTKTASVFPRGHFFQQMAGAVQVDVAEMVSPRGFYGLVPSATFPYGCLRTDDGAMFEIVRRFSHHGQGLAQEGAAVDEVLDKPPTLLLFQSTELDGKQLRYDLERMQKQAASDHFDRGLENGRAYWRSVAGARGRPYEITFDGEQVTWKEEGLFSLTGKILKPGLHWYLPGRDYGTYYVSQFVLVEGEVEGRPCRGFISFDQNYMGEGGNLYRDKDLVMANQGHIVWYTWATLYDDGTWEGGHFMMGNGTLGFAVWTDGTTTTYTQDIKGLVTQRPGTPFADRIDLVIDGEQWVFKPDPRGAMPDMLRRHPPTPQQEGLWQRVGETRTPAVWFAWGETEPDHGNFPLDHLLTEPIRV